jgi:hypothetical protein
MKTREQLEDQISDEVRVGAGGDYEWADIQKIINIVVSFCEETIKESPEWAFENLKKLKSSKAIEEIKL